MFKNKTVVKVRASFFCFAFTAYLDVLAINKLSLKNQTNSKISADQKYNNLTDNLVSYSNCNEI